MANEDSAFREVDQELAEERQAAMFRKYGPAIIGGAVAVVLGVGAWQMWTARQEAVARENALEFQSAVETLAEDEPAGREALDAIAEGGEGGYGVLARFERAASFARAGERDAAVAAFRRIYDDGAAPKNLRDLARLRAAYLSLNEGRDAALAHLGDLAESGGALSHHANEVAGLAALEAEDYETALATFRRLSAEVGAPQPVRTRAEEFAALAAAAKSGVNISGAVRLEDVLGAVGDGEAEETAEPEAAAGAVEETVQTPDDQAADQEDEPEAETPPDEDAAEAAAEDSRSE